MSISLGQTVSDIFVEKHRYEVPAYQRKYSWGADEASELFDDISSTSSFSDKKLFLGTLIFQKAKGKGKSNLRFIVDGQQRITTLSLLLIACRRHVDNHFKDKNQGHQIDRKIQHTDEVDASKAHPLLSPSQQLQDFYAAVADRNSDLNSDSAETADAKSKGKKRAGRGRSIASEIRHSSSNSQSVRRAKEVLSLFAERLMKEYSDRRTYNQFYAALLKANFFVFIVDTEQEAMELFERTNARGRKLEVSDLLKNMLFSKIKDRHVIDDYWAKFDKFAGEDPSKVLKYYYYTVNGFIQKSTLYEQLKKLLRNKLMTPEALAKEVAIFSEFHRNCDRGNIAEITESFISLEFSKLLNVDANRLAVVRSLQALRLFRVTQHIPLVYAMLISARRIEDGGVSCIKNLVLFMNSLEKFHFRYNAIGRQPSNKFEKLYSNYAKKFGSLGAREGDKFYTLCSEVVKEQKLIAESAVSPARFTDKFTAITYEDSDKDLIMYIFDRLNSRGAKPGSSPVVVYEPDSRALNKIFSIEHIFPKNPKRNPPSLRHNIGNLIALNTDLNGAFNDMLPADKLKFIRDPKNVDKVRQLTSLPIFTELIDEFERYFSAWDDSVIEKRAATLASQSFASLASF